MTDDIKNQDATPADKVKVGLAIALVLAGIVAYYLLGNQPSWVRWVAMVAGLVLAAVVANFTFYGAEFRRFVASARIELRKVVWPTRQETWQTTAVVFGFVVIAGVFFWLLDLVLAWATKQLTGQGS
jgi:preprotein translocase subunit SecE